MAQEIGRKKNATLKIQFLDPLLQLLSWSGGKVQESPTNKQGPHQLHTRVYWSLKLLQLLFEVLMLKGEGRWGKSSCPIFLPFCSSATTAGPFYLVSWQWLQSYARLPGTKPNLTQGGFLVGMHRIVLIVTVILCTMNAGDQDTSSEWGEPQCNSTRWAPTEDKMNEWVTSRKKKDGNLWFSKSSTGIQMTHCIISEEIRINSIFVWSLGVSVALRLLSGLLSKVVLNLDSFCVGGLESKSPWLNQILTVDCGKLPPEEPHLLTIRFLNE